MGKALVQDKLTLPRMPERFAQRTVYMTSSHALCVCVVITCLCEHYNTRHRRLAIRCWEQAHDHSQTRNSKLCKVSLLSQGYQCFHVIWNTRISPHPDTGNVPLAGHKSLHSHCYTLCINEPRPEPSMEAHNVSCEVCDRHYKYGE